MLSICTPFFIIEILFISHFINSPSSTVSLNYFFAFDDEFFRSSLSASVFPLLSIKPVIVQAYHSVAWKF